MKTKKKAISLIVLVITIIVLAILAATVVISIVNSGIINSSKDSVKSYDLAQVKEIASLAWAEALVEFAGQSDITDAEYDAYVKQQLTNAGVNIGDYNIGATSSGVTVTQNEDQTETEYAGLTITADTEGFTFIPVDGVEVTDERLANLQVGDKVVYGDYVYAYGCEQERNIAIENMYAFAESGIDGWGCSVIDESIDKTELGELCGTILGEPVVSLKFAFGYWSEGGNALYRSGMQHLSVAPKIPSSVTNMSGAFMCCDALTKAPVIPASVTNMSKTFSYCTKLTSKVQINSELVENMNNCFGGITEEITVKVPADSTTYTTITTSYLGSDNITIETFVPET